MTKPAPLRLLAEDEDDLAVISAALQDAVAKVGDIEWDAKGRRFTLALNRFRWEAPGALLGERVRAGLQFGGVLAVKSRNLRREAPDAVVSLLAVSFEAAGEPPGGDIRLHLSGGGDVVLTVECVDAALADVSQPWPTASQPTHKE
ncbi:MAG TPA: DUF2948 family protein [Caulobacteraceae bacterium]|jgi:hypothetical protein